MAILPATVVTSVVCDVCSQSATHASAAGAISSRRFFRNEGWIIPDVGELIQDTTGRPLLAVCPRCAPLIRIITSAIEPTTLVSRP